MDPLNWYNWTNVALVQTALGDYEAAIDTAERGLQAASHSQIADQLVIAYMAAGQFEEALAASQRHIEDEQSRHTYRFKRAAAMGDAIEAKALRDEIGDKFGVESLRIGHFAVVGDRERANQLAAETDAYPLGFLQLLNMIGGCNCGAPFDLEITPNFARLIEEADLPWPPPSPIDWPLKDW